MALKIEGTVEYGEKVYEATGAFRNPAVGEFFLTDTNSVLIGCGAIYGRRIILREVKPPHVYKVGDWVRVIKDKPKGAGLVAGDVRQVTQVRPGSLNLHREGFAVGLEDVEPCDPPAPKYRPFASAEEFKPHRDRWIARSGKGAMNVVEYSDSRVWLGAGSNPITFDDLMVWCFDDDGSPCGVLITE